MSMYRGHLLLQQQPRSPAYIARAARQGHPQATTKLLMWHQANLWLLKSRSPHNNNNNNNNYNSTLFGFIYVHFTHVGGLGQTWGPAVGCPG